MSIIQKHWIIPIWRAFRNSQFRRFSASPMPLRCSTTCAKELPPAVTAAPKWMYELPFNSGKPGCERPLDSKVWRTAMQNDRKHIEKKLIDYLGKQEHGKPFNFDEIQKELGVGEEETRELLRPF